MIFPIFFGQVVTLLSTIVPNVVVSLQKFLFEVETEQLLGFEIKTTLLEFQK